MTERTLLIGGEWVEGADGAYEVVNPATEEVVGVAPEASVAQAHDAARAAAGGVPGVVADHARDARRAAAQAAAAIKARAKDLLPLVIAETGCTATRRQADAGAAPRGRASTATRGRARADRDPAAAEGDARARRSRPAGSWARSRAASPSAPSACITPYNFPIVNMAGKLGPALAMGNTVVVRPASQDPLAVIDLVRILHEVGFPPGVINCVTGSTPATGEALVETRDIDMVSFTGSTGVGMRIAEVGGRTMKRLLLELGGKGAALVLDDADVKTAVQMIGSVWTFHSGQICTAPTRAIVHRSKYDAVVEGLAKMAKVLKVGDPYEPDTVRRPADHRAAPRPRRELHARRGATKAARSSPAASAPERLDKGFYLEPTLIAGCRPGMKVVREEIFGPVIVAVPFDDDDEGIAIANDTDFGLYDYVFSGDTNRAIRAGKRLRAGNIGINTVQRNHETPFGGTKYSGVGRDGGAFGLHAYSELQTVVWPG